MAAHAPAGTQAYVRRTRPTPGKPWTWRARPSCAAPPDRPSEDAEADDDYEMPPAYYTLPEVKEEQESTVGGTAGSGPESTHLPSPVPSFVRRVKAEPRERAVSPGGIL